MRILRAAHRRPAARGHAGRPPLHLLRLQALSVFPHLARRFFGALSSAPPAPADSDWVRSVLTPGCHGLWMRMAPADQRHAVGVARRVAVSLGPDATPPVLAAALLHDVGKIESGLSTWERVPATLIGMAFGRQRFGGRVGAYLDHPRLGAALLSAAGADPLTVTWAAEHHSSTSTLPSVIATALRAADDD